MTESVNELQSLSTLSKNNSIHFDFDQTRLTSFLCALKSAEAKRRYPARLKKFFDFDEIKSSFETKTVFVGISLE